MVVRQETHPGTGAGAWPPEFREAVESMHAARLRPEVFCEEMPAPQRIAPYAAAMSADVTVDDTDLGTGRIILLHDPAGQRRLGRHLPVRGLRPRRDRPRADHRPAAGRGRLVLADRGARTPTGRSYLAASGTVTRVATDSFGGMADEGGSAQIEVRASWTPCLPPKAEAGTPLDIGAHVGGLG